MILPMFPLGTVLLPGCLLPLHVFEERYRKLFADLTGEKQVFGICLIERGSEVGGGDVRFNVGTLARVLMRRDLDEGRLAVVVGGTNRIRVDRWLPELDYPQAEVAEFPDLEDVDVESVDDIRPLVTRVNSIATELGYESRSIDPLEQGGPTVRLYHLIDSTPLDVLDRQRLLQAEKLSDRLTLFRSLLHELESTLLMKMSQLDG
jgi:Lon protease-like protein